MVVAAKPAPRGAFAREGATPNGLLAVGCLAPTTARCKDVCGDLSLTDTAGLHAY